LFDAASLAELRRAAEDAATAGDATFSIPAAAPVAERLATMAEGSLRQEAEGWLRAGASYHALVRLAGEVVKACAGDGWPTETVYVPKAEGELEAMLRLWPAVLALPTAQPLTAPDLVALRAFPVHPLGIVNTPSWADGRLCTPAEYFFHDLDHARFKIREDLLVEGMALPDAYQEGTTWDARTGRHRMILDAAFGRIGPTLWNEAESRAALAGRLLAYGASLDEPRAAAAELLLFEILCEKSYPLDVNVLARELHSGVHVDKIRRKHASGFYGHDVPEPGTMSVLDEVSMLLRNIL
jgi:hypothetical protein